MTKQDDSHVHSHDHAEPAVAPVETASKTKKKSAPAVKADQHSELVAENVVFELTIPADALEQARQKALSRAQRTMKVDGFRHGKVPLKIVEQRMSETGLMELMVEESLPAAYSAAVAQKGIQPLTEPEVKPIAMAPGQDWKFEVAVATMPQVDTSSVEAIVTKLRASNELWTGDQKETPEQKLRQDQLQAVLTSVLEEIKVPVPELLLRRETEHLLHDLSHQLEHLGLTIDDYLEKINQTKEALQQDTAFRAMGSLQVEILFANLIRRWEIKLDQKELEDVVATRLANDSQKRKTITRQELDMIQASMLKQKTVDRLLTIGA